METDEKVRAVHYYTSEGMRTALVGRPGTKWLHLVVIDHPIRRIRVPLSEERYMSDLKKSPAAVARHYNRIARVNGITKGAKALIKEVLHSGRKESVHSGDDSGVRDLGVHSPDEGEPRPQVD